MHTRLVTAALVLGLWAPASGDAAPPKLAGEWVGQVSEAMPFPLILHVGQEARLDSPERGVFGMLGEARQRERHVSIVFANGAAFEGDVIGDRLAGDYLRGPAALPLAFERKRSWLGRIMARRGRGVPVARLALLEPLAGGAFALGGELLEQQGEDDEGAALDIRRLRTGVPIHGHVEGELGDKGVAAEHADHRRAGVAGAGVGGDNPAELIRRGGHRRSICSSWRAAPTMAGYGCSTR